MIVRFYRWLGLSRWDAEALAETQTFIVAVMATVAAMVVIGSWVIPPIFNG